VALEVNGYDGIVYLNRREGLSEADDAKIYNSEDPDWFDEISDAQFKKEIPSAEYSYIAINRNQIKSAPGNIGTYLNEVEDIRFSRPATKDQSLPDLFQSLGKFDKAPESINHPDAERIRYVQDNFLELLTELESNKKVEIKC
jgi:hypothetical protein